MTLKKVLIANRGEIACRIVRTARRMGLGTVAVHSDADARALHVRAADEAVYIGPSPATESYLVIDKIIAAAKATGADCIHPGYGFLAENADFADAVTAAGLAFIGPSGKAMRALGGKAAAKEIAIKAGVSVVPGYQGGKQDAATLGIEAKRIGYPVMIKAVAGGGGRGMRLVEREEDLPALLESAQREAAAAFGNPNVLVEKVVVRPRHVEVQVFGDRHGNVVHLFERDCSLQRRNQKVIEEAPAPGMSAALREQICGAAVKLAKAVGYEGAGTVEFLIEGGTLGPKAPWYFIEMNTRLQVEHPVTEEITGLDLVEWQLRVAAGEKLPLKQKDIAMRGHAVEVRLCAEDPAQGFMPSIGRIEAFEPRGEAPVRWETGVGPGSEVSPFYDSMIAKLIVHRETREEALRDASVALAQTVVTGVRTNGRFLRNLLALKEMRAGTADTGLIGREIERVAASPVSIHAVRAGLVSLLFGYGRPEAKGGANDPWAARDGFELGPPRTVTRDVVIDGKPAKVREAWTTRAGVSVPLLELEGTHGYETPSQSPMLVVRPGQDGRIHILDRLTEVVVGWPAYSAEGDEGHAGDTVRAPITGKLAKVFVSEGQAIEKGERVAVVEAMKMEHVLHATRAGRIKRVAAKEGAQLTQGALIAEIGE